jgi:hypothetical protein
MFSICIRHLFPGIDQTEGKKEEEGLRGELVDVSQGFPIVWF